MRISRRAWKAVHQVCILRCHDCTVLRAEKWEGFRQQLEVRHHLRCFPVLPQCLERPPKSSALPYATRLT